MKRSQFKLPDHSCVFVPCTKQTRSTVTDSVRKKQLLKMNVKSYHLTSWCKPVIYSYSYKKGIKFSTGYKEICPLKVRTYAENQHSANLGFLFQIDLQLKKRQKDSAQSAGWWKKRSQMKYSYRRPDELPTAICMVVSCGSSEMYDCPLSIMLTIHVGMLHCCQH